MFFALCCPDTIFPLIIRCSRTDPGAVSLLDGCFHHEFLHSHLVITEAQSLPYMQPARCLGWKFSIEEGSLVCTVVIYLNCIFLSNSIFPPLLLTGWFTLGQSRRCREERLCQPTHNSPVADGADEVEVDSCINQWLMVLIGGSIKSRADHPC